MRCYNYNELALEQNRSHLEIKPRACLCGNSSTNNTVTADGDTMQIVALLACSLVEWAAQVSATQRTCVANTMVGVKELATAPMANLCAHAGEDPT